MIAKTHFVILPKSDEEYFLSQTELWSHIRSSLRPQLFHHLRGKVSCLCECSITKSCPTLLTCGFYGPPGSLCPWGCPCSNIGLGCHFLIQGSSQLRIEPRSAVSFALARGLFTIEPPGSVSRYLIAGNQICSRWLPY